MVSAMTSNTKHLGLRLSSEEHAALTEAAARQDRSMSWLVRKIVTTWLADNPPQQPPFETKRAPRKKT